MVWGRHLLLMGLPYPGYGSAICRLSFCKDTGSDYGEAKTHKKVPHIMKNAKTLRLMAKRRSSSVQYIP